MGAQVVLVAGITVLLWCVCVFFGGGGVLLGVLLGGSY